MHLALRTSVLRIMKRKIDSSASHFPWEKRTSSFQYSTAPPPRKGYPLGNYPSYYTFRQDETGSDPRLTVIQPVWLHDRRVLDIGCNSGWLTMELAFRFGCSEIVGVDIDGTLIETANQQLQERIQSLQTQQKNPQNTDNTTQTTTSNNNTNTDTNKDNNNANINYDNTKDNNNLTTIPQTTIVPRITFLEEDFVNSTTVHEPFDTITCFSVSKWIHLNWGDEGILQLFRKVRKYLRAGGYFVFEPQGVESYYMNTIDISPTTNRNQKKNKISPEQFHTILTNRFGFKHVSEYKIFSRKQYAFNRKIVIYQKPEKL